MGGSRVFTRQPSHLPLILTASLCCKAIQLGLHLLQLRLHSWQAALQCAAKVVISDCSPAVLQASARS